MALSIDKITMYEGRLYLWKCPGTGIGDGVWEMLVLPLFPDLMVVYV